MDTTLLSTKLNRPPVTSDLVARPRLVARLQEHPERGLTLVSAPAGYGKTTLLSEWLDGHSSPSAWVSLDENDNHLNLFLRYLVAALQTQFPNDFGEMLALLVAPQPLTVQVLVTAFVNQIDELPERVILVLDDFHAIQNGAVIEFLSLLVQNLPPKLHLVLATRIVPVLPLARPRASGNLLELRFADLRFTKGETETFVQHILHHDVDSQTLTWLDQRVLGWVVGLRLASLSLQGESHLADLNITVSGRERLMAEFLTDQVLSQQPEPVQTFLLRTSLVDRFCAPLGEILLKDMEVVTAPQPNDGLDSAATHAVAILDEIERANLFLIPLDVEGVWFRYHPLFQELLQQRLAKQLKPAQLASLNQQASKWFEANGLVEEALRHALKAGDFTEAARLVETHAYTYFNREDWRTVERWIGQIPSETVEQRPFLQMVQAWLWFLQWKLEAIPPLLARLESQLERGALEPATENLVRSYIYTLGAQSMFWAADLERCLQTTRLALDLTPPNYRFLRGLAWLYRGIALQATGSARQTFSEFDQLLEQDGYQIDQFSGRLLTGKFAAHFLEDELQQTVQTCERLSNMAQQGNLSESLGWAHDGWGRVNYEWNRLEEAVVHFSKTIELRHAANARAVHSSYLGLALTYQALGRSEQASQTAVNAREFALASGFPTLPYLSNSFAARLALLQGDLESAIRQAGVIPLEFTPNIFLLVEAPEMTKLQVLIAEASAASLRAAESWYEILAQFCTRTHNKHFMTNLLALHALLQSAQGKDDLALETLRTAVDSVRGPRRTRLFGDLGKTMAALLQTLATSAPDDKFIRQILMAFEPRPITPTPSQPWVVNSPITPTLIEPLTRRELEILKLLPTHLSAKEIAKQLYISPLTVRSHTQNIYAKLGATNRNDAVETAIQAGLLASV